MIVYLKDKGYSIKFPDDMSPEDIERVIYTHVYNMPVLEAEKPGFLERLRTEIPKESPVKGLVSGAEKVTNLFRRRKVIRAPLYTEEEKEAFKPAGYAQVNVKDIARKAIPNKKEFVMGLGKRIYKGMLESATLANKLFLLDKVFRLQDPEPTLRKLAKETQPRTATERYAYDLAESLGGLLITLPLDAMTGAATKGALLPRVTPRIARYLAEIPDFAIGMGLRGTIEGTKEGGISKGLRKGAENLAWGIIYGKLGETRLVPKLAALGAGESAYNALRKGKLPTKEELKEGTIHGASLGIMFTLVPWLKRTTKVTKEKIALARLEKQLQRSLEEGDFPGIDAEIKNLPKHAQLRKELREALGKITDDVEDIVRRQTQKRETPYEEPTLIGEKPEVTPKEILAPSGEPIRHYMEMEKIKEILAKPPVTRTAEDILALRKFRQENKGLIAIPETRAKPRGVTTFGETARERRLAEEREIAKKVDEELSKLEKAKKKEPWQMTREEYRQMPKEEWAKVTASSKYDDLPPKIKKIAREKYIKETGDKEGANPKSKEFTLPKFIFNKQTGDIIGDDYPTHKQEVEQALASGKPVPPEVLKDYPDLAKKYGKRPTKQPAIPKGLEPLVKEAKKPEATEPLDKLPVVRFTKKLYKEAKPIDIVSVKDVHPKARRGVPFYMVLETKEGRVLSPISEKRAKELYPELAKKKELFAKPRKLEARPDYITELKQRGFTEAQLNKASDETIRDIYEKSLKPEQVSILPGGEYKVVEGPGTEARREAKKEAETTGTTEEPVVAVSKLYPDNLYEVEKTTPHGYIVKRAITISPEGKIQELPGADFVRGKEFPKENFEIMPFSKYLEKTEQEARATEQAKAVKEKVKAPAEYFIQIEEAGALKTKPVEKFYPFEYKGIQLFAHRERDPSVWDVNEKQTGLLIAGGRKTRKGAIQAAEEKLDEEGIERAKKRLREASKNIIPYEKPTSERSVPTFSSYKQAIKAVREMAKNAPEHPEWEKVEQLKKQLSNEPEKYGEYEKKIGDLQEGFGKIKIKIKDTVYEVHNNKQTLEEFADALSERAKETKEIKGQYALELPETEIKKETVKTPTREINRKFLELPEIVQLAKALADGKYPKVRKVIARTQLGVVLGRLLPKRKEIEVAAEAFKDPEKAAKTLAHEIGHLVDYLPNETLARGNILGRIATLHKYYKQFLPEVPDDLNKVFSAKDRLNFMAKAREVAEVEGRAKDTQYVKSVYRQILKDAAKERGLVSRDEIMEELKELTRKWRPFDPGTNRAYTKYRYRSRELYADAFSVLLNNPELLRRTCPKFFKAFFNWLEKKPEVKQIYEGLQEKILDREAILQQRHEFTRDMYKRGEVTFSKKLEALSPGKNLFKQLKYDLMDRYAAVYEGASKIKEPIPPEENPIYAVEEIAYTPGEVKSWVREIDRCYDKLREHNITWEDLGEWLMHERIIYERKDIANPGGFAGKPEVSKTEYASSVEQLEFLKKKLGKEKAEVLEGAVADFRKAWKYILDKLEDSQLISKSLAEKLRKNPYYATFNVIKYYERKYGPGITSHVFRQYGTLEEIANPASSTVLKGISIIKSANVNKAKLKIVNFWKEHSLGISEAETRWNGSYREPIKPRDQRLGLLRVVEDGKLKGYYVDRYLAKAFQSGGWEGNIITDVLIAGNRVFKELFVNINPGFWLFNVLRDYMRAYANLPFLRRHTTLLKYYVRALKPAFRRGFERYDRLIDEMERGKELISIEQKWGLSSEDKVIERILKRYSLRGKEWDNKITKPFLMFYHYLEAVGHSIEALPKVAGHLYLKEHTNLPAVVRAHIIRGDIGSPDFMRKGDKWALYNNFFLFSNAMKEGVRSDIEVMRERPGEYWYKKAKTVFLPKLIMWAAALGLFGNDLKKMMANVSMYDMTNYMIIPLGMAPNSKTVYLRVPQDETGRFLGGLFIKGLFALTPKEVFKRDITITDIFDYMAGQAPTLTPTIGLAIDIASYLAGRNPYNYFYGKNAVPPQAFKAGGWISHKEFLKYLWNQGGLGIIYRFKSYDLGGVKTELEKVLQYPILSNIIGRFIKIDNYGKVEELKQLRREIEGERAKENWQIKDALIEHFNSGKAKPSSQDATQMYEEMVKEGIIKRKSFTDFLDAYKKMAFYRLGNPYLDAYLRARTTEEKMEILQRFMEDTERENNKSWWQKIKRGAK